MLQDAFVDLINSMIKYQDESGMWYQIVNYGGMDKNYLETSGSSIMAYALLKGVRLGILPESYVEYAKKAIDGICDKYLKTKKVRCHLEEFVLLPDLAVKTEDLVHTIITCQNQSLKMMQGC